MDRSDLIESFNFTQAFCLFRDQADACRVMDNIILVPKDKQFMRLVCAENHEMISRIVVNYIKKKVSLSTQSALETYLRDKMDQGNEFIHLFSVQDDYGMVYYLKCVMQPSHTFTVPVRIVPLAGACATGVSNVNANELKRRIKANPNVSTLYHSWTEHMSSPITQSDIPIYMRLSMDFFDPTADGRSRYKRDAASSEPFMLHLNAKICPSNEMVEIEARDAAFMSQRQCAWPVCGKLDQMKNFKFKFCAGCKRVVYCSEKCQKSDWRYHRLLCTSGRLGQHDPRLVMKECTKREGPRCLACKNRATKKCSRCLLMCYCSKECQTTHWKSHRTQCTNIREKIVSINKVMCQHGLPSNQNLQVAPADNQGSLVARIPKASNWDQISHDPRFIFDQSYQQSIPGKNLFAAAQAHQKGKLNWATNAENEKKLILGHFSVDSMDALLEFMIKTGISIENYILIDMLVDPELQPHIIECIARGMNPVSLMNFEESRILAPCRELQSMENHENDTSLEKILQFMRIGVRVPAYSDCEKI